MANDSGGGWVVLGLLALGLYTCSNNDDDSGSSIADEEYAYVDEQTSSGDQVYSYSDHSAAEEEEREYFDEDAARDAAEDELSSDSYASIGRPYGCTIDCSGHDAGFAWAAEGNEDGGVSNSQSFDEGQRAYEEAVDDRVEEMRDEYESGEEPY